jgi:hypothetical protein
MLGLLLPELSRAATGQSGQGLAVSPPIISASANPGQSIVVQVNVQNITNSPLIMNSAADDFGAKDENGNPQLLFDEKTSTRYSLKFWIAPIESPIIQPKTRITVPVTIDVPANAEPGGHYGVIQLTGKAPNVSGSGVALSASIGVLVLLTVNGTVVQHLSPVDVTISHNNKAGNFFEYGPLTFAERIKNDGNLHEAPSGNITITNLFGGKPIVIGVNGARGNILPDSIRKFSQDYAKTSLFGYFTIKGSLTYDTNKTIVLPATSFWVIPYRLLIGVIAALVVLFFLLRFALKRYNRRIIERARRG